MRDYGRVHTTFWASETLRSLDDDAKMLALYLLTCRHAHMSGAFQLPIAYAAHDLGWVPERLSNGFKTLSDAGWLKRCDRTEWVLIVNFTKFNPPDNPNQRKAIDKQLALIPASCAFKPIDDETVSEPLDNTPVPVPVPVPVLKEPREDFDGILSAYHAILPNCQRIAVMTDKRKRLFRESVKLAKRICRERGWDYGDDFWRDFFAECAKDPWRRGEVANPNNAAWRQSIDVLLRDDQFAKVMDSALGGGQ